jgi:hypothetical protein
MRGMALPTAEVDAGSSVASYAQAGFPGELLINKGQDLLHKPTQRVVIGTSLLVYSADEQHAGPLEKWRFGACGREGVADHVDIRHTKRTERFGFGPTYGNHALAEGGVAEFPPDFGNDVKGLFEKKSAHGITSAGDCLGVQYHQGLAGQPGERFLKRGAHRIKVMRAGDPDEVEAVCALREEAGKLT